MGYAKPVDADSRDELLVATDGMTQAHRETACRVVLRVIGPDAVCFESDIPGGWRREAWTPEHRAAVNYLLSAGNAVAGRHRPERTGYAQTGIIRAGDADLWRAFVTVAPLAFDASV